MSIFYYMHPSSPVPVLYLVRMPDGDIMYALESVNGPGDVDSSPERAIQAYFDRIGAGDYAGASGFLLKADGQGLRPMDGASIAGMKNNMSQTYGETGEKTAIQYVLTESVSPTGTIDGHEAAIAHWKSIQYSRLDGQVYGIDHTFNLVKVGGWRIIV